MRRQAIHAAFIALAAILTPLTAAAFAGGRPAAPPAPGNAIVRAGACSQAVGPFETQRQAYQALHYAQAQGYGTGPVYGQGGLYSNYSNRRWYFTVYYAC